MYKVSYEKILGNIGNLTTLSFDSLNIAQRVYDITREQLGLYIMRSPRPQ